jgi:hypothetical protein
MPKQIIPIQFGGIDYDGEPGTIGNRSGDSKNIRLNLKRGIETIKGCSKWNTTLVGEWIDNFTATILDPSWTLTPSGYPLYSLTDYPGYFALTVPSGVAHNNPIRLLRVISDSRDFTIETKIEIPVGVVFKEAGLKAYSSFLNYVQFGIRYNGTIWQCYWKRYYSGGYNSYLEGNLTGISNVYLKMARTSGGVYKCYYALNEIDWTCLASQPPDAEPGAINIGIGGDSEGQASFPILFKFDYYREYGKFLIPTITGLFDYTKKDLSQKIIAGTLTDLSYGSAGSNRWTSFKTGLSGVIGDWWSFGILNDLLVCANGKDALQYWNGGFALSYTVTANQWITKTSLQTARCNPGGFYVNGYGYVCGGSAAPLVGELAINEQYDILSDTWTYKASLNTARFEIGTFVLTYGYAVGGRTTSMLAFSTTEQYDHNINLWIAKQNLTTGRQYLCGFATPNYGYAVGGDPLTAGTEQYNPLLDVWVAKAQLTYPRFGLASFFLDGCGYVVGGSDPVLCSKLEKYYEYGNTWTVKANLGTGRGYLSSFVLGDNGYTAGGFLMDTSVKSAVTEQYNYISNIWCYKSSITTATTRLSSFSSPSGGFIVGGQIDAGTVSTVERYMNYPTPPVCKYLIQHKDRMFGAYTSNYPSRLFWTSLVNSENWEVNNFQDINPSDGQQINGLFKLHDTLYISKKANMYSLTGNDFNPATGNYAVVQMEGVEGAISHRSICIANNVVYYIDIYGRFIEFNGISTKLIGASRLDKYCFNNLIADPDYVFSIHFEKYYEVWWGFNTDIHITKIFIYNYALDEFYGPETINITVGDVMMIDKVPTFLSGDYISGYVMQQDIGYNFDDLVIDSYYKTDWLDFGAKWFKKIFYKLLLLVKKVGGWNLSIDHYIDYNTNSLKTNTVDLSPSNIDQYQRVDLATKPGRRIQIKVGTNTINQYFVLNEASTEVDIVDEGRI